MAMDEFCAISIAEIRKTYPQISQQEAEEIQALLVLMTDMVFEEVLSKHQPEDVEETDTTC